MSIIQRFVKVLYDVITLKGGWDQMTPPLSLSGGVARDCLNFECAPTGGYSRVAGYERVDGRPAPSDALVTLVQVVSFTNTPTTGQTLTGNSSGATGVIVSVGSNYVALTKVTGTFSTPETVKVGATTIGTTTTLTVNPTAKEDAQQLAAAADVYRTDIGKPPGEGPVRGVFTMVRSGVDYVYAFRNNVGGTQCKLYVSSASGWTAVDLGYEVYFTAGAGGVAPQPGETLTQGGVTATVRKVVEISGSDTWTGATVGKAVIGAPSGGNFAAGAATFSGGASATLSAIQTAITLQPNGRFDLEEGNVGGSSSTAAIYGADGVNRGFEFDGTAFVPVDNGTSIAPSHVMVLKQHVMWSVDASIVSSGPGTPFRFATADGGSEIAVGAGITGFLVQPGSQATGSAAVFTRTTTSILYGTSSADWNLVAFNIGTGAIAFSAQNMAQSYVMDDRGVNSLSTTLSYGNFVQSSLTAGIRKFVLAERTKVACSSILREKSQYRVFFNDGYGLFVTIVNNRMLGVMPVYFTSVPYCAWNSVNAAGAEVSYFGDEDGYVQQMERGSSFDGQDISAYVALNWNNMGSPRVLKRYRKASVEMQGDYYADISFAYDVAYGTTEKGQASATEYPSGFTPASNWDSFTWDNFTWDGRTLFPTEVGVTGTGENIRAVISSSGNYIYPYTVNSIIYHYTPRRGLR